MALVGTFTRYFASPRRLGQLIFAPEVARALEHGKQNVLYFKLRCGGRKPLRQWAKWPIPVGSPTEASFEPRAGKKARTSN